MDIRNCKCQWGHHRKPVLLRLARFPRGITSQTSFITSIWAGIPKQRQFKGMAQGIEHDHYQRAHPHEVPWEMGRSIRKEWQYLPPTFSRMGLFDLTTETTAATINSLLQHYGTDSPVGITLQATMENLQIELGVSGCPLNYDYTIWAHLVTNSWIKSLHA